MPTTSIQPFQAGRAIEFDVIDYDTDGVTVDLIEPLTVFTSDPAVAAVWIPADRPRVIVVSGLSAGTSMITVTAPGVPVGGILQVTVQVLPSPGNLSRIEMGAVRGPTPQV